jgi:hypothetical protein
MNTTTITSHDIPDLFWAETGEVTCQKHSPYKGSDTWNSGRWAVMSAHDRIEWAKMAGAPAVCEICR